MSIEVVVSFIENFYNLKFVVVVKFGDCVFFFVIVLLKKDVKEYVVDLVL